MAQKQTSPSTLALLLIGTAAFAGFSILTAIILVILVSLGIIS